ncbi:MAG: ABC transporter ATP-binding protein [Chloroflexi bacterium]|jgi:putative ABC transport system ATP-binding protein|nr:ABC transporter ATP-binding protein [Chloroflexota bacterium]
MSTFFLQTKKISKIYKHNGGEVQALRDVDLDIRVGELVAVMGPSGSGKSTLLHILGGLDNPTSGEVWVAGQQIDNMSEARRAILRRKQIGFVFQAFNLIGNMSVGDNIELPAMVAGSPASQARQRRDGLLHDLGMKDRARHIPAQLSGGERQRVALARALVNQPAVLLADEPTGNLDSRTAFDVLRLLRQTHQQGQTILIVTHDPNVASIAQRVIFMKDGQITSETILREQHDARALLTEMLDMEA